MGIETRGYPLLDEIKAANGWPSEARFKKGPVAIIECVQGIPCNPCQEACPQKAIHVGDSITNTPKLDAEACIGCGLCIAACPGLAIFVVDKSGEKALISFPFEYLPAPKKGDQVKALNRAGEFVCMGEVVRVICPKSYANTTVVTIAVPQQYADDVRTIARANARVLLSPQTAEDLEEILPDDVIACRCEEVTVGEIRKAIREYHATSLTEIKRRVRSGMGLCQGRTCSKIVTRILSQEIGVPPSQIATITERPPVRPVSFAELAGGGDDEQIL